MFTIQIHIKAKGEKIIKEVSDEAIEALIESNISLGLLSIFERLIVTEIAVSTAPSDTRENISANILMQVPNEALKADNEEKSIENVELSIEDIVASNLLTIFDIVSIDKVIILPDKTDTTIALNSGKSFLTRIPKATSDIIRTSILFVIVSLVTAIILFLLSLTFSTQSNSIFQNIWTGIGFSSSIMIVMTFLINVITIILYQNRARGKTAEKNKDSNLNGQDSRERSHTI